MDAEFAAYAAIAARRRTALGTCGPVASRPAAELQRVDVNDWNDHWQAFFTNFEAQEEDAKMELDNDNDAISRKLSLTALNVDPAGRTAKGNERRTLLYAESALQRIAASFGALEYVAVADRTASVQFTTALGALKMRAFLESCGVPEAGLAAADLMVTSPPADNVATTRLQMRGLTNQFGRPTDPGIKLEYAQALFSALGASEVKEDVDTAGAKRFVGDFRTASEAREALHLLSAQLLHRYRLCVLFV
jgi:hypothetical protein